MGTPLPPGADRRGPRFISWLQPGFDYRIVSIGTEGEIERSRGQQRGG